MMAEIEIVYRKGYCRFDMSDYSIQCHSCIASDKGCRHFHGDKRTTENGATVIPFGDCVNADYEYKYKGWSGTKYEIEKIEDDGFLGYDSMLVTLGRTTYDCVKVTLNGRCIFNEYDEEKVQETKV